MCGNNGNCPLRQEMESASSVRDGGRPGATRTTKKVLTQHLRQLEADGVVVRTDKSDVVLHVEYEISAISREEIRALLDQLASWGARHLISAEPNEI
jgi:DNA-binding HxlR family transcriptional regulator